MHSQSDKVPHPPPQPGISKLSTPTIYAYKICSYEMVERQACASEREVIEVAGSNHAIAVILNLAWGPNNFSPSLIGAGGQGVTLELAWGPSYSSLRNLHFSFAVFSIFSFNIIIFFLSFYLFFCGEIMFFMFFLIWSWYLSLAFFPFLLFYLFFLLLSTPGKILAESHHKAPITTFSTIFSHREILLNRLPNGS